ncbi:hypothetical protein Mapa_004752 [Marchantia paleacea]|nr:hypothetical protein Mapa_004752 [Marchantia paleacea]
MAIITLGMRFDCLELGKMGYFQSPKEGIIEALWWRNKGTINQSSPSTINLLTRSHKTNNNTHNEIKQVEDNHNKTRSPKECRLLSIPFHSTTSGVCSKAYQLPIIDSQKPLT